MKNTVSHLRSEEACRGLVEKTRARVQGYLAHKNPPPRGSLQKPYAYGDPRGVGFSYERSTLVGDMTNPRPYHARVSEGVLRSSSRRARI